MARQELIYDQGPGGSTYKEYTWGKGLTKSLSGDEADKAVANRGSGVGKESKKDKKG